MGEFKGTPGPWHYVVERDNVIKDSKGETLMCDMTYYPWCPDKDEDWQLIAAAPEMLSALQAVEDWWLSSGMKMANGAPYAIFAVRSAIRKALGEP